MNPCSACKWYVRDDFRDPDDPEDDYLVEGCWRPDIPKCANTPNGGPDYTWRQRRYVKPFDVLLSVCGKRGRFWEPSPDTPRDAG